MSIPQAERMLKACAAKLQEIDSSDLLRCGDEALAQTIAIFDASDVYSRDQIADVVADLSTKSLTSIRATDRAIIMRRKAAELQKKEDALSDMMCAATHGGKCARCCSAAKRRKMGCFAIVFAVLGVIGVIGVAAGIAVLCVTKPWTGGAAAPSATNIAKEFVDLKLGVLTTSAGNL